MSILTVSNLAKSFGADVLFSDITFSVAAGQKLGLIGRNGGGKTTLLKILLGQELPDPSNNQPPKINLANGRRMGYLRQEAPVHPERTIAEEIEVALEPYRAVQARISAAEHAMSDATDDESLNKALEEYTEALDEFESRGGYEIESEKDATLMRLGFGPETLEKQVGSCSGGEQTRLALAKLVLTRPDLLILDEPTNHLDISAVEWLEGFLKEYAGAVILVSHDRYFLDAVVDSIAELEFQKLTLYKGNYSHFRRQKEEKLQRQQDMYDQQQKEIARLNDLIKRNMGANNTASIIRHKTQGRIERMDKVEAVRTDTSRVKAKIDDKNAGRIGREVLNLSGVAKVYGERTLFADLNAIVERGDRVGFVGPNGAGKTTLVKMLLGEEEPTAGTIQWGHNVRTAYFSQHATDALDVQKTVLDTLRDEAPAWNETQLRSYLARFLFMGDDVFKQVQMLSGGEKNKLALSCMLLEPCNLLILDEPTNHLDIESCETLGQMLQDYAGTLFLVSHDRYLLNAVTNKTLGLTGTGSAELIEGNYATWREQQNPTAVAAPKPKFAAVAAPPVARMDNKARGKTQAALEKAEARIATLEARLAELEASLGTGTGDLVALAAEHTKTQDELATTLTEWERLSEEIG
jgi:ATP-binding cassette subfamily F protein 3